MPTIKYPKKSHRKHIFIPEESIQLAELMGIIAGDGGINNDWQLVISLNSIKDFDYSYHVANLLEELFKITVVRRKRPNQNTLVLVCSSTSLLEFLIQKGAVRGNKIIGKIDIPLWIKYNQQYLKYFLRGLIDTDGCIYIHKHKVKGIYYENIGLCFTNFSLILLDSVSRTLTEFKINHSVTENGRRIYLYSEESVKNYLDIFGSSNPRIYERYTVWKNKKQITGGV